MAHHQAVARVFLRLGSLDRRDEVAQVERDRVHTDLLAGIGGRRPLRAVAVGVDLDPVAVGVAQVERLGDAVVRRAGERLARAGDAQRGMCEVAPRGMKQREVEEAGVASGGLRRAVLVQHDERLRAGAERGHAVDRLAGHEADDVLVVRDRAREVCDRQVHGAEPKPVGEGGAVARVGGAGGLGAHRSS